MFGATLKFYKIQGLNCNFSQGSAVSVTVRMVPAPRGAGIVASRVPKKVLRLTGIEDVFISSRGSTTLGNFVKVMRIADKGADLVRITVQGKKDADSCFEIKSTLVQKNYNIPLVADIHFAPSVALRVVECFDKIRVNPRNFADRRAQFEKLEYTEDTRKNSSTLSRSDLSYIKIGFGSYYTARTIT